MNYYAVLYHKYFDQKGRSTIAELDFMQDCVALNVIALNGWWVYHSKL